MMLGSFLDGFGHHVGWFWWGNFWIDFGWFGMVPGWFRDDFDGFLASLGVVLG